MELADDQLFNKLMAHCIEIQHTKQAAHNVKNRRFIGLQKLAKAVWWRRAKSWENRFSQHAAVAGSNKQKRIAPLKRNAKWRADYAEELAKFRAGEPAMLQRGSYFLPSIYNSTTSLAPSRLERSPEPARSATLRASPFSYRSSRSIERPLPAQEPAQTLLGLIC